MNQSQLNRQLIEALDEGDINMVKQLIEKGVDVNQGQFFGWTPLIWASRGGHLEIVKYLLSHGANVNQANDDGNTPLIFASREGREGHLEVVKYLVEHGADVNQANNAGWTPLIWASRRGHLEIVKYLVSHNANYSSIKDKPIFIDIIKDQSNKLKTELTGRYGMVKNIPGITLPKDALLRTVYEEPYQRYCNPPGEGLPPIQLIALTNILNNTMPKKRGLIEYGGKYESIDLHISWKELCDKVKAALFLLL